VNTEETDASMANESLGVYKIVYGSLVRRDVRHEKETHEDLDRLGSSRESHNRILSESSFFSREYKQGKKARGIGNGSMENPS
jgi:hypothetical protein